MASCGRKRHRVAVVGQQGHGSCGFVRLLLLVAWSCGCVTIVPGCQGGSACGCSTLQETALVGHI
jgi:hypothetical protein